MTDINKELEAIAEDVFVDEDEQLVEEPANAPTLHAGTRHADATHGWSG